MQHQRATDQQYTTSELGILLVEMNLHVIEIKDQVKSTNGRVKSLELWKQFLLGAWAVLTVIISFSIPIFWYLIKSHIGYLESELDRKITNAIQENNNKFFEDN